jgi:ABC-type glycerol-3-phosphate transport system substrate-binding protein
MISKNKLLCIFGNLIIISILITACGTSTPTTAAQTTAPAVATTAPAEVVTLNVMHYYADGVADQAQMVEWGQKFEAIYPQIKINWIWGGANVDQLFQAAINSGDVPDVAANNDAAIALFAREGVIQPLDQYLATQNFEGNAVWKDTFVGSLIENGHITDGKLGDHYYGIPDNMNFQGIFYNKAMFAEHGYQIPKTWPELLALCDQIKADLNIPCFAQDNADWTNMIPSFSIMSRVMGAQKVYDTGMGKEGTSFNTPEFLKSAQMIQELTTKYFEPTWSGNQWPAGEMAWASNESAAFIFMRSWLPSEVLSTQASGFVPGVFDVPTIPDGYTGKPDLEVKFNGWFIPVGAKNTEQAITFMKFFTSIDYQKARSDQYALASVLTAVGLPPDLADFNAVFAADNSVRFIGGLDADAANWESSIYGPLNTQLMLGQLTPEEFIKQMDEQTVTFYKQ